MKATVFNICITGADKLPEVFQCFDPQSSSNIYIYIYFTSCIITNYPMIYLLARPTAKSGDASESKPAMLAVYDERIHFQVRGGGVQISLRMGTGAWDYVIYIL